MKALKQILRPSRFWLFLTFSLLSTPVWAQANGTTFWTEEAFFYTMVGLIFIVALLVLLVAIYVLQMLKRFVRKDMTEEQRVAYDAEPGPLTRLWSKWNDFKPVESEGDILLNHDYDGIKELDNHLPPWWKGLFYLTIVYAVIYLMVFHVFKSSPLQEEQYEIEMALAEEARALRQSVEVISFDESQVEITNDPIELAEGKKTFEQQCAICHKADGGGLAGPNLTDEYWRNGGSIQNVYDVIKNGVPNTAMISWSQSFSPDKMRKVSSYVLTLVGTNPPGALGPDGELYVPDGGK